MYRALGRRGAPGRRFTPVILWALSWARHEPIWLILSTGRTFVDFYYFEIYFKIYFKNLFFEKFLKILIIFQKFLKTFI